MVVVCGGAVLSEIYRGKNFNTMIIHPIHRRRTLPRVYRSEVQSSDICLCVAYIKIIVPKVLSFYVVIECSLNITIANWEKCVLSLII